MGERCLYLWRVFRTRIKYYVPILKWLPRYDIQRDLVHDVLAGVTVALLLIPQSLSYASGLAHLEPVFGLYACFAPILVYSILGTKCYVCMYVIRQLAVGPEALISLLIGSTIQKTVGPDATMEEHASIATTLCFLVGIISFALGLARLGFVDSVMSRALLRGFITAVACVISIEQLPTLLGLPASIHPQVAPLPITPRFHLAAAAMEQEAEESPFMKLLRVLQHLQDANWVAVLFSSISVSFLFGFALLKRRLLVRYSEAQRRAVAAETSLPRPPAVSDSQDIQKISSFQEYRESTLLLDESQFISPSNTIEGNTLPAPSSERRLNLPWHIRLIVMLPEILLVVVPSILISYCARLQVDVLGEDAMKGGFRRPYLPKFSKLNGLLTPALMISVLGFVESIVVVKMYGSKYNYTVSANRELVAFGALNLVGSLVNSFPAFSSMARSQVNDSAGARTQVAGVVTGFIILLTILFFLPLFYWLPKCVMASIVLVAASGLLEFEDIHFMWKIRAWSDMGMMMLTFCITMFWSIEAGVLISIGLSLILVVKHSTYPKISILGRVAEGFSENRHISGPIKYKYKPLDEIYATPGHRFSLEDLEILVVKVEESLFFANTGQMKDRLRRAEAYAGLLHIHPSEEEHRKIGGGQMRKGRSSSRRRTSISRDCSPSPSRTRPDMFASTSVVRTDSVSRSFGTFRGEAIGAASSSSSPRNNIAVDMDEEGTTTDDRGSAAEEADNTESSSATDVIPQLRAVIFDIENMPKIDASAVQILTEIVAEYHARSIEVCFVKLRDANKPIFLRSGLLGELIGSDRYFRKIQDAVTFLAAQKTSSPMHAHPGFSTYSVL